MKTIKQILLTMAVLLFSLTAKTYGFEVDGIYYNITNSTKKTVEVTYNSSYSKYSGDIVIPDTVVYNGKTYSVIGIYYQAFRDCYGITNITIPNSVTSIGNSAFYGCTGLVSVIIPNSVTSIGEYAFKDCHSLASITIPNSVTTIGKFAFENCHRFTSITIPNSVTHIYGGAFDGCNSLKELYIEDCEKSLRLDYYEINNNGHVDTYGLFIQCPLENLYCGRNLNYKRKDSGGSQLSEMSPFNNVHELKSVTIGGHMTSIDSHAFYGCTSLVDIVIPNSVTSIGSYAFYGCTSLVDIVIPNSVTSIGSYAFRGCTGLVDIVIPNSVTSIGFYAFNGCTSLISLTIGNGVTEIDYAFVGCTSLERIYMLSRIANVYNENIFSTTTYNNATLYVPEGREFAYSKTVPWSNFYIKELKNSYNVTYKIDSEIYAIYSVECFSEIPMPDAPTKEGYTFSGWSEVPETMPAEDITITGSFSVNAYAITYIVDGEVYATDSLAYGSEIVLLDEPTKEGHTFSGWSEAPEIMPAKDITITGSFSVNYYTITYIVDGEVYATDSLAYGSEIVLIDEPTKEGYTFSGWSEAPETMPAEDITITGSFSVNSYTITYIVDGEVYATDSLAYGSEIVLIDEPTKEGHTFSGWSEIPETMPANDIEITGSFSVNTYTITYIVDGEVYATDELTYGSGIVLRDEPVKEGHTFSGWSEAPETMPAEDIAITGSFSVNTYAITYIVDGEVYATDSLAYGSEIVLIDEPTKEGYTFSGWSEAPETMPAEDIEITGSFIPTENVSEVEFDANIQTTNNGIILLNANNNWVRVYAINGILVKKIDNYTGEEITLNKGVYIVSVGNKAIKIML